MRRLNGGSSAGRQFGEPKGSRLNRPLRLFCAWCARSRWADKTSWRRKH